MDRVQMITLIYINHLYHISDDYRNPRELPKKKCVISLNSVKLGCRFQGSQQHTSPGEHEQFIVSVQTN